MFVCVSRLFPANLSLRRAAGEGLMVVLSRSPSGDVLDLYPVAVAPCTAVCG